MNRLSNVGKLSKGAIVGLDPTNLLASVILFQYNPSQITRNLDAQTSTSNDGDRSEALRLKGAPIETINMDIEIDATDQLETADPLAVASGIYPQLSALELLIYPKSAQVLENTALLAAGTLEILPSTAPLTLLIWGAKRVLPVRINNFSITEEMHDLNLNPIQAKISLGLRVLSYSDLSVTHPGYHLFLANQVVKEAMATVGSTNTLSTAFVGRTSIL